MKNKSFIRTGRDLLLPDMNKQLFTTNDKLIFDHMFNVTFEPRVPFLRVNSESHLPMQNWGVGMGVWETVLFCDVDLSILSVIRIVRKNKKKVSLFVVTVSVAIFFCCPEKRSVGKIGKIKSIKSVSIWRLVKVHTDSVSLNWLQFPQNSCPISGNKRETSNHKAFLWLVQWQLNDILIAAAIILYNNH